MTTQQKQITALLLLALICHCGTTRANELTDSFVSNLRWSVDLASRTLHQPKANKTSYIQMTGLDVHSVIGDHSGDKGTFVLQTYLTRIDNLKPHPTHFDDDHDWALVFRTFAFNYTGTSAYASNIPNIRIGHLVLPYGLEETIDTSGQLRDYNHRSNLGLKTDWGISLNKQQRHFEYEISYTLGNQQKLKPLDNSHVLSGRVGTTRNANQVYGLSFFDARMSQQKRRKIAIDVQFYRHLWGYLGEVSHGKHAGHTTKEALLELNWRNSRETLLLYAQGSHFAKDGVSSQQYLTHGLLYEPDNNWSVGVKFKRMLKSNTNGQKTSQLGLQLRYRY